nr:zinc finger BED domain-containing protein RICESLEEPER 2-like [Ipomoea batatas]
MDFRQRTAASLCAGSCWLSWVRLLLPFTIGYHGRVALRRRKAAPAVAISSTGIADDIEHPRVHPDMPPNVPPSDTVHNDISVNNNRDMSMPAEHSPTHTSNSEHTSVAQPPRSTRICQPSSMLQDYYSDTITCNRTSPHCLSNIESLDNLDNTHKVFSAAVASIAQPRTYKQAFNPHLCAAPLSLLTYNSLCLNDSIRPSSPEASTGDNYSVSGSIFASSPLYRSQPCLHLSAFRPLSFSAVPAPLRKVIGAVSCQLKIRNMSIHLQM